MIQLFLQYFDAVGLTTQQGHPSQ